MNFNVFFFVFNPSSNRTGIKSSSLTLICTTCYCDLGGMCVNLVSAETFLCRGIIPINLFTFKATANNSCRIYTLFILSNHSVTLRFVWKCHVLYFGIYSDCAFNLSARLCILKKGLKLSAVNIPLPPQTSLTISPHNTLLQV